MGFFKQPEDFSFSKRRKSSGCVGVEEGGGRRNNGRVEANLAQDVFHLGVLLAPPCD